MLSGGKELVSDQVGHEGGALTNGISAHIQETPESSFIPSACEGTEEEAIQEAERKLSPDRICQHLDLTSQPRDCEKGKSVVYATYGIFVFLLYVQVFLLLQPKQTKTAIFQDKMCGPYWTRAKPQKFYKERESFFKKFFNYVRELSHIRQRFMSKLFLKIHFKRLTNNIVKGSPGC